MPEKPPLRGCLLNLSPVRADERSRGGRHTAPAPDRRRQPLDGSPDNASHRHAKLLEALIVTIILLVLAAVTSPQAAY